MQLREKKYLNEITFDQRYNLAKIKRELYQMIAHSGKGEETGFYNIVDTLEDLSFIGTEINQYKLILLQVVNEMIALDEITFDIDRLYNFRIALSSN